MDILLSKSLYILFTFLRSFSFYLLRFKSAAISGISKSFSSIETFLNFFLLCLRFLGFLIKDWKYAMESWTACYSFVRGYSTSSFFVSRVLGCKKDFANSIDSLILCSSLLSFCYFYGFSFSNFLSISYLSVYA